MNPIKALESLTGMLDHDKAAILLVHGDLKPSCLVTLSGEVYVQSEPPMHVDQESLQTLETILKELGLFYSTKIRLYDNEGEDENLSQEVARLFIAKAQDTADTLRFYFEDLNTYDAEAGLLLGYPETAVHAFVNGGLLPMDDTPESTQEVSAQNMQLLGYRLSEHHWNEEVKPLQAQGEYLQKVSPIIYAHTTEI